MRDDYDIKPIYVRDFGVSLSTTCDTCYFVIALDVHKADVTFMTSARRDQREFYYHYIQI